METNIGTLYCCKLIVFDRKTKTITSITSDPRVKVLFICFLTVFCLSGCPSTYIFINIIK